jgi:transposase
MVGLSAYAFPPGETCQFDWRHETAVIGGVEQTVKVAHFRLSYSRQMFVIAYPRETQEMVLDAHHRRSTGSVTVVERCTTTPA